MYKICTECGKEFPAITEFFHKAKRGKYGLSAVCKECKSIYHKQHYDPEHQKQYYIKNIERIKQYCIDNRDKISRRNKKWCINNKKYCVEYNKNYHANHPENRIEASKRACKWARENKDKMNAHAAKRRALKRNAMLFDANLELIQFYYMVCSTMADYEVDHIKPLSKGGLHHQDNLQLLKKTLNMEKHNKYPLTNEEQEKYKGFRL